MQRPSLRLIVLHLQSLVGNRYFHSSSFYLYNILFFLTMRAHINSEQNFPPVRLFWLACRSAIARCISLPITDVGGRSLPFKIGCAVSILVCCYFIFLVFYIGTVCWLVLCWNWFLWWIFYLRSICCVCFIFIFLKFFVLLVSWYTSSLVSFYMWNWFRTNFFRLFINFSRRLVKRKCSVVIIINISSSRV